MQNDLDPKGLGKTEVERLCRERAMAQWEASTKRPDLDERARVIGAIQAYQRQTFALGHLSAVPDGEGELVEVADALTEFSDIDEAEGGNPHVIATERRAATLLREAASRLSRAGVRVTDEMVELATSELMDRMNVLGFVHPTRDGHRALVTNLARRALEAALSGDTL